MKNIEGLYTAINALIAERENDNRVCIDMAEMIDALTDEVDVYSASIDWYVHFAIRSAIQIGLWQAGYRSVVKGEGLFINPQNTRKPEYLARLFNNAVLSEKQKQSVVEMLTGCIKNAGIEGQLSFDFSGQIHEDISEAQLIEMLRKDAV